MKLEDILDEEALKKFIADRKDEIVGAQTDTIVKLKKQEKRKRKKLSVGQDGSEEDAAKEAELLSQAVTYIKEIPCESLMPMALFDKDALLEVEIPDITAEKKAILMFAADERITKAIKIFREQYPKWKKAMKQLLPKAEKNNNNEVVSGQLKAPKAEENVLLTANNNSEVVSEQSEIVNNEESVSGPPKKKNKKRKAGVDSEVIASPKKIKLDETNGDSSLSKKNKKKNKNKKKLLNGNTKAEKNNNNEVISGQLEAVKVEESVPLNPKKLKNKKKKRKADVDSEVTASPEKTKLDEINGNSSLPKKKQKKKNQKNKKKSLISKNSSEGETNGAVAENEDEAKLKEKAVDTETLGGKHSPMKENKPFVKKGPSHPPPMGGKQKFNNNADGYRQPFRNGRDRGNSYKNGSGSMPPWKIRRYIDKDSPNIISVSSDWQNKVSEPKGDDENKPSLLRPAWLTNPEEHKRLSSEISNFRQSYTGSANHIYVSKDWKNKSPKKDGDNTPCGSSLLKPTWLTNPEEHTPQQDSKKFGNGFRKSYNGFRGNRGK